MALEHGIATTGITTLFTFDMVLANVRPVARNVMAVLPFFHIYGTVVVLNWAIFNCATTILVPRFEIDEFMDILANFEKITFFPAVPTMINAVINHPKAGELETGSDDVPKGQPGELIVRSPLVMKE